jgi:hypothetical protein
MYDDQRVALRDMELSDVAPFVAYWYRASTAFLRSMGVNPETMKPEGEFEDFLTSTIRGNAVSSPSRLPLLAIVVDGRAVGSHSIGDLLAGESAVFHAHVWEPALRGTGLCTYTYPRAAQLFMDRFSLGQMLFKTPTSNVAANRIKDKLGLRCIGQERITAPFMLEGLTANVYRLDRRDVQRLLG